VAESSWPSPSNGRVVDDSQYEKIGTLLGAVHGVLGDFTNPQLVYGDSTGRQFKVAADRYALVRGHIWWSGSSIVTVPIAANTSGSTRIDLVVLRLSRTTWDVNLVVIAGTPGAGAPASTQNSGTTGVWDMTLAQVTVANNASTITAANVAYYGVHLDPMGGRARIPDISRPWGSWGAYKGQEFVDANGIVVRWNGSSFDEKYAWKTYVPTIWHNVITTRTIYGGGYVVNDARWNQVGKMVNVIVDVTITGVTTGGVAVQLPVVAASRYYAIGSLALYNSSGAATLQSGIATIGPTANDNALVLTTSNGYCNTTTGTNAIRGQMTYEAAAYP
jgi:hypothetical protein